MENKLAIVIPAYKSQFFRRALESIAAQTRKDFKLYVCDDGSKENLKEIAEEFSPSVNIEYIRFEENVGRTSLVEHWNRSVSTALEEWVWLFSDDDVMSENCVELFYKHLDEQCESFDVYRFNIEMIDMNGRVICVKEKHPQIEHPYDFLVRRLNSRCLSAGVEYIFKKEAFAKNNGFVNFPLAFCSDDASWIQFSGDKAIFTITEALVYWRSSGINISSRQGLQIPKIKAYFEFISWVKRKYQNNNSEISGYLETWFFESLKYVNGRISPFDQIGIARQLTKLLGGSQWHYFKALLLLKYNFNEYK